MNAWSHRVNTHLESISILLVSLPHKDQTDLRHVLHHADWKITAASNLGEASLILRERPPSVILCERNLPDGNWKDVLDKGAQHMNPAMVLVISAHADDSLWAEVLNLGGCDVLMKPLQRLRSNASSPSCMAALEEACAQEGSRSATPRR
jgi:DNA-binding response OmpR family regulator